jgi:hypothetical protein
MAQTPSSDNVIRPSEFAGGGSGPHDPTIGARLDRLESAVDDIRKELQAIRIDLARMDGKLSNVPTTVTLIGIVVTVLAAGFGMALAVARLASGH